MKSPVSATTEPRIKVRRLPRRSSSRSRPWQTKSLFVLLGIVSQATASPVVHFDDGKGFIRRTDHNLLPTQLYWPAEEKYSRKQDGVNADGLRGEWSTYNRKVPFV